MYVCAVPGHFFGDNACDKPLRMDEDKAKDKLKYKLKICLLLCETLAS